MEIKKIIYKIKKEDEGYNQLWKEYQSLIKSIAKDFSNTYNNNYEDVRQNSYIAFRELVDDFKIDKVESNIKTAFTAYIKNYLPLRLRNFDDGYSLFSSTKKDVHSLSNNINAEHMSSDLKYNKFTDDFHKRMDMDNQFNNLSDREKEVYKLLRKGYDDGYIAEVLGITHQNVYQQRKRIRKKLE